MFRSSGLGLLLALLRGIRSIGHTLKSFILRCLFFCPHLFRNLKHIWSLCSRAGPKDATKKKGGGARPSSPGAPGVYEGYSTIYASRDPIRAGESHIPIGPMGGSQSTLQSPALSLRSLPGSPQRSDRRLSVGSTPGSHNTDSINGGRQLTIRHLNTPLTLTHSRVTSTQFAGAPPSRSRSPSPSLLPPFSFSFPSPSPSPSPSPNLHPHPLPLSDIQESSGSAQISDVMSIPHDPLEGSRRPSVDIRVSPPSRSRTLEPNIQNTFNSPQFPLPSQQGHFPGLSQSPTREPSDPGPSYLALSHGNALHSSGTLAVGALTPPSDQRRDGPSFPQPFTSQVSVVNIPVADASGTRSDGNTRSIRLMHSEQVSRYVKKGDISPRNNEIRLRPTSVDLPQYADAMRPKGWVPATHPGGALYFYNAELRIFTDVYMYNPDHFPKNYDLVLDIIKTENDETIWAYYYVDHNARTLFWVHYYECGDSSMLSEVRGVQGSGHIKNRLESLYWVHWSLYPTGPDWRKFPRNAPNELLGVLLSSGIDSLTSKVSTSPYTVAEIESMRDFIKEAESLGPENPHVITSVGNEVVFRSTNPETLTSFPPARLLSFYAHWKFIHLHGQKSSRLDCYKSIYKDSRRKRTMLVRILSPILFFFPDVHLLELEKVWTDKIVVEALWKEFMQKLVSEWTEFVLYSTVMLAANVAFLAIPGVIVAPQNTSSPNAWIKPSPAQIASSISLVFSIGSIITGLLLIRRNRTMMTKAPKSAWYYLYGMSWPVVGLEPLAIVFSLTYALLMWSAWGFFVALLIFSFQDTSMRIWIPVGTAAGVITILIIWVIGNTWDPKEQEEEYIDKLYEPEPLAEDGAQA
ncbi:hypothetical protein EDB83DRAFT_320689 [Lactarius deliciosus]|nr:hypothetical protein EDB83DRAFT_320689 [Lactarius deliciosus]